MPTPGAPETKTFSVCERNRAVASLADQSLIDGRLKSEIKVVQRLDRGKVDALQAHRDSCPLFGVDLLLEHTVERIEVGGLGPRGIAKERVNALGHIPEAQPGRLLDHASMGDGAHSAPPPTTGA